VNIVDVQGAIVHFAGWGLVRIAMETALLASKIGEIELGSMPAADSRADPLIAEVAGIFETVLEAAGATPDDSIASLGGDSLQAIKVAIELEARFGLAIPVSIFELTWTIRELAHSIAAQNKKFLPSKITEHGKADDPIPLAAEINTSFLEQRAPFLNQSDVAGWVEAINYLLSISHVNVAEYGLRHLRVRFPTVTYVNRVGAVLDRLPLAGTPLPFEDNPAKDVQIVARDGAETVLLLFCGAADNLGLPLSVVHSWAGRLNASLIYLRDFQRCYYLRGVQSLGRTRGATLAELRRLVASLGGRRIAGYGSSSGVFGALRYCLDLEAEAVLCAGGVANLSPEFAGSRREQKAIQLRAEMPDVVLDLRLSYAGASRPPRVHMFFGQDNRDDRVQAEHMARLPCVTLQAIENFDEHNCIVELIRRGQFEEVLHRLVPLAPALTGKLTA
jgi:acyl carrier protein